MSQFAYPVAKNAQDALSQLRKGPPVRAAREREAEALAGAPVAFVTESVGPAYEQREDALAAGAWIDDVAYALVARIKPSARDKRTRLEPDFRDGRRWPEAKAPRVTVWQASVTYWKVLGEARRTAPPSTRPARALRKKGGESLTPDEVLGLAHSPLQPLRPQKGLDFGLFDFRLPENPDIVIADE